MKWRKGSRNYYLMKVFTLNRAVLGLSQRIWSLNNLHYNWSLCLASYQRSRLQREKVPLANWSEPVRRILLRVYFISRTFLTVQNKIWIQHHMECLPPSQKYTERTNRWVDTCTVWAQFTRRYVFFVPKGRGLEIYCDQKKSDAYCPKYHR
jgi:hypothetical protein